VVNFYFFQSHYSLDLIQHALRAESIAKNIKHGSRKLESGETPPYPPERRKDFFGKKFEIMLQTLWQLLRQRLY
jgi:hypothetical protein